jgi:hypothetical protein
VGGISIPEGQGWLLIINFEISMPGQTLRCLNRRRSSGYQNLKTKGNASKKLTINQNGCTFAEPTPHEIRLHVVEGYPS